MPLHNTPHNTLRQCLPAVRGTLHEAVPLASTTWFKVGGVAEFLFNPADEADLAQFLAALPGDIPVTMLGLASNVIVRDGGIKGVVVRLGAPFRQIDVEDNVITAGAGAVDALVARTALNHGLTGMEFYSGIPGSIGGALRMNAGAYGGETSAVLLEATALDRAGNRHVLNNAAMGFAYRHCGVPEDWIFIAAKFQARPGDPAAIAAKMQEIQTSRSTSQPIRSYTGGSTFANPPGHKAWQLIDAAGCRGLQQGGAQVSPQHCNFLINTGNATAADLETLGETVQARVEALSGVRLRWEIRRLGEC